jgi:DNA-binding NarL/FixJ family response regulator
MARPNRAARDLANDLQRVQVGGPRALDLFLPRIQRLIGADIGHAYGLHLEDDRIHFDFVDMLDGPAGAAELIRAAGSGGGRFGLYNPATPEPSQRNRAIRVNATITGPMVEAMERANAQLRRMGMDFPANDQLRVLVCDGSQLVAWVGGYLRGNFSKEAEQQLDHIIPSLRDRLILERRVALADQLETALVAALESMTVAAFLVRPSGHVVQANEIGRGALARDRAVVREEIERSLAQAPDAPYRSVSLASPGLPPLSLLVQRPRVASLESRLAECAEQFHLTPRQAQVLGLLAQGQANKEIAAALRCSVRTVEVHVTAVLIKLDVDSRAGAASRLWGYTPTPSGASATSGPAR